MEQHKVEGPAQRVAVMAAALVGIGVSRYTGLLGLVPLAFTAAAWWLASRLLGENKRLVIPAFAVQCGHALWMTLPFLILGKINENIADVALLAAGLAWLIAKPGRAPLLLLGVYQLLAILHNGYMFYGAEVGSTAHKALLVHLIWRGLALFFNVQLLLKLRNQQAEAEAVPDASSMDAPGSSKT